MHKHVAGFRFYEELNYFLPKQKRKKMVAYEFIGKPSVKDAIEAMGVPHTEIPRGGILITESCRRGWSGSRPWPGKWPGVGLQRSLCRTWCAGSGAAIGTP